MQVNSNVNIISDEDYINFQYDKLEEDLNNLEILVDLNCIVPYWGKVATVVISIFEVIKLVIFAVNNTSILTNQRMISVIGHLTIHNFLWLIETKPWVGTAVYIARICKAYSVGDSRLYVTTGHDLKVFPYASLVKKDWKILGSDNELVARARSMYEIEAYKRGGENKISLEVRLNIARQIVNGLLHP